MSLKTTVLNIDGKTIKLAQIGHGLMSFTTVETPVPDEQAFESIKASLESVPEGTKMLINSGEFYGRNPHEANLDLLSRFFEKYPELADKAFLSVKGGFNFTAFVPECEPEGLKRSVDNCLSRLRGKKKIDLFQCARVDQKVPLEETIKTLAGFVKEGKFDFIGMSECKAETFRRASAVHPIAIVEIEVSPISYDELVKDVIVATKELGAAVAAYSPLGHGFLSGAFKNASDLPKTDFRTRLQRFQEGYAEHNIAIADGITSIASKKNITPAQLCLAWVCSLGPHIIPIPGSTRKTRTLENIAAGSVELTQADLDEITELLNKHPVQGLRYFAGAEDLLWG